MKNRYTRVVDPIVYVAIASVCVHALAIARNGVTYPPFPLLWLTGLWTVFTLALAIGHLCRSLLSDRSCETWARQVRLLMLAALLIPTVVLAFSPGRLFCWPLGNMAFRASGDCAKLQTWAGKVAMEDDRKAPSSHVGVRRLPRADVSDFVREMGPGVPTVDVWSGAARRNAFDGANADTGFVALAWGRGGEEHGLLVGPTTFRIRSTARRQVYAISEGVYRFEER